jgi:hypothetical protein
MLPSVPPAALAATDRTPYGVCLEILFSRDVYYYYAKSKSNSIVGSWL